MTSKSPSTTRRRRTSVRGSFDLPADSSGAWFAGFERHERRSAVPAPPTPGAERFGGIGILREVLHGIPFALAYGGDVYLPDGPETARRITPTGRFSPSAWSRDMRRLAVLGRATGGESAVWISNEGSSVKAISVRRPGDPTHAVFSPDGRSIAVTTTRGRLSILSVDGGEIASVMVASGHKLFEPAWSPSGDLVACVAEDSSRSRSLHLVPLADLKSTRRLLAVDAPASEDKSLADPEFALDGQHLYVRALWGPKGEPRRARLLRIPVAGPRSAVIPVAPPLSQVRLRGGVSCWRDEAFFLAGIRREPDGVHRKKAKRGKTSEAAWLSPADLEPAAEPGALRLVSSPTGARLAFGAADRSVVFARRTASGTSVWRTSDHRKYAKVRLPFPAWLCLA